MPKLPVPVLLAAATFLPSGVAAALMPLPVKVETAAGRLPIDISFSARASGCSDPRLNAALVRFTARLARQTGIPIGLGQPANAAHPALAVECTGTSAASSPTWPTLGEDESYTLDVSPDGARIQATAAAGVLHGLETFSQLVAPSADGFAVPGIHIEDRPRFPWRGLMLDVSRHWMPLAVVERNLDAMAAVKLNVFHWHLSDDQGIRVESKRFPKLQQLGSDGHFYTQEEIRQVVAYARDRGIRVVPEFDIPGHTQSWLAAYPELAAAPPTGGTYEIGRTWGIYDPVLDPTREETYRFLDAFLSEMAALFPDSYFHIGGDEVRATQWDASPAIQAFARKHKLDGAHGLQVYFNQRIQKILEKNRKTMIGWDEILHPDLPSTIVIQSWRGQKSLADAAREGRRGILSSGYYLDHLSPARQHYAVDPLGGEASGLSPEEAARVLGGEACMWTEYVNAETVDSRIWPRAAVIAERLWSPKEVTDVDSMYHRMEAVSRWLEWTGIRHRDNYAPMLDRLAGGAGSGLSAEPLRVLADASEALGIGVRAHARKYTSLVPLNRFVDAVPPESESIRALEQAAAQATPESLVLLREKFTLWSANDARFQALAGDNALLAELKPLSRDLASLGVTGLKALDYLATAQPAPADWLAAQTSEIARILRPNAEVTLAAARPVRILLERLGTKGQQ